jgi:catechol 2,3-dioxygenase-like lactoylglutathione lyase family enzyme
MSLTSTTGTLPAGKDGPVPRIATVTLVVRDYDEAIAFYVDAVGFALLEDTDQGEGRRWVRVAPSGGGAVLLLAKAANAGELQRVGDQTGGRVCLFLETDDFGRDHARMTAAGVRFLEEPRAEPYGTVAVWEDLYGNRWDLIQQR